MTHHAVLERTARNMHDCDSKPKSEVREIGRVCLINRTVFLEQTEITHARKLQKRCVKSQEKETERLPSA